MEFKHTLLQFWFFQAHKLPAGRRSVGKNNVLENFMNPWFYLELERKSKDRYRET